MQVSIFQEQLLRRLQIVQRAVGGRKTLEILTHVLLSTDDDGLKLAATDLEMGIVTRGHAMVFEEGAVALPVKALIDLVRNLPPERVDITACEDGESVKLTCAKNTVTLKGMSADSFPVLPEPPETGIECDAAALREAARRTLIATATEDSRPILTGVLVQPEETGEERALTFAAANGFQLSVVRHTLNGGAFTPFAGPSGPLSLIVPGRAIGELSRLLVGASEPVMIAFEEGRALFRVTDSTLLSTSLIDGQFPNYHAIIPTAWTTRAIIDRRKLLDACKQIAVFAREANNTMKFTFTPDVEDEIGTVTLYANAGEAGDGTKVIDATVEGNPLEIHFNAAYLIDALGVMAADYVEMTLQKAENPALIQPYEDAGDFRYVVMPKHG